MGTAGVLPVEQPSSWPLCQLQRDGCLWGSTSQHCIFGLSSTSLWLLLIYLAWIITLSLRDAQLWSSMPSLENGRIRSSFLRGFLPDLSMHLADKRPFYPASLYIYLAVSSLVLYRCFPCSASPPSLLALAQVPWFFSVLFWFFCGCWDPYVFIYNHRQGDFLVLSITVTQGLILFFMKISVRISFYIYGKRLTRSMIMSWKII